MGRLSNDASGTDHSWSAGKRGLVSLCLVVIAMCLGQPVIGAAAGADSKSAVVFMYHRFGEPDYPTTSVTLEQFDSHLEAIGTNGYKVAPLPDIVSALKKRNPIPDRTIALTIDDAFASVYAKAWPRLRAKGLPFTLFVSTDAIDRGAPGYMTWDQIRDLAQWGATIGSQTASHLHMPTANAEKIIDDLSRSMRRFKEELGFVPTLFAYPYGEYSIAAKEAVERAGFEAAFGQHSGVAFSGIDLFTLPRFALNEKFGNLDRFHMAARALPLPVTDLTPEDTLIIANPPPFGFSILEEVSGLGALACFYSHETAAADMIRLGPQRFEVRAKKPLPPGRGRVNCTAPAGDKRWRWFGIQFIVPG